MKAHFKVWTSDMKECESFVYPCRNPKEFADRFIEFLADRFPGNTFHLVPIGKNRFNVIPQPPANA